MLAVIIVETFESHDGMHCSSRPLMTWLFQQTFRWSDKDSQLAAIELLPLIISSKFLCRAPQEDPPYSSHHGR